MTTQNIFSWPPFDKKEKRKKKKEKRKKKKKTIFTRK
jgi:hypothetical protein